MDSTEEWQHKLLLYCLCLCCHSTVLSMFMLSFYSTVYVYVVILLYCPCLWLMNDNINMDSTVEWSMNDNINMDSTVEWSMNDNINMCLCCHSTVLSMFMLSFYCTVHVYVVILLYCPCLCCHSTVLSMFMLSLHRQYSRMTT
jgi:hypothetical protein